jgi:hypothetical protein
MNEYTKALIEEEIKRGESLKNKTFSKEVSDKISEALKEGVDKAKKTPLKKEEANKVNDTSVKKTTTEDTKNTDGKGVTTESNPLRDQYRAAARTKLLSKVSGVDPENPLASITGKKQAPPDHQYDIMGRLNVDKRRAQYGIRKQFAMPLQPITGRPLGAKKGCFVTAKVKIGKNRKTKIL